MGARALVDALLNRNPKLRPSADEAILHQWLVLNATAQSAAVPKRVLALEDSEESIEEAHHELEVWQAFRHFDETPATSCVKSSADAVLTVPAAAAESKTLGFFWRATLVNMLISAWHDARGAQCPVEGKVVAKRDHLPNISSFVKLVLLRLLLELIVLGKLPRPSPLRRIARVVAAALLRR